MAPEVHYTEAGKRFVVLLRPVVNTGQYIKRRVLKKEIDIYLIRFIHSRSHRDIESSAEAFHDRSNKFSLCETSETLDITIFFQAARFFFLKAAQCVSTLLENSVHVTYKSGKFN